MGCGAGVEDMPRSAPTIHLDYTVREKPVQFPHQLVYTATWLRERQLCGGELGFQSAVYKLRDNFYSTVCWELKELLNITDLEPYEYFC